MSATIYVKSTGDDFNFEELEFIHRFSDQARVWAYLLYKEAGLIQSYDEWMAKGLMTPRYQAKSTGLGIG